ncbi:MAG: hypothetical protein EOO38_24235 [Cytophagaceae bacterium]|nr:MAG: hypothetical protein EOO38_24235 [Cytophagaceae bacterium]
MSQTSQVQLWSVGQCIYGHGHTPPFTKEHILAANLGGEVTLGHATCKACQEIINAEIEQPCMRRMFLHIRYRRGIGSRRVRGRPTELPVLTRRSQTIDSPVDSINTDEWQKEFVPTSEHPSILVMPVYQSPGIMRGIDAACALKEEVGAWLHTEPWHYSEATSSDVHVQTETNFSVFDRFLAKTAHCATVARYGLHTFKPLLTDMILGRDMSQTRYLIGCTPPEAPSDKHYSFRFSRPTNGPLAGYIVCLFRLFADLGSPTYLIVSGKI